LSRKFLKVFIRHNENGSYGFKCVIDGVKMKNYVTGEAVEKGDFGSMGPPQAPLFLGLPYLVGLVSIRLNDEQLLNPFYG
jgi:hypothetical protein